MSCSKTKLPRPVRGNAFNIAVKVVARRLDGTVIDDFELSSDDVLNIVYRGTLTPTAFTIEDNNVALIHFDGTQAVGMYGVDFGGVWAGESWRFALPIIFQVVDQTSQGWLPKDGIIVDPTYEVVASITIATAGSTVQADWAETDPDAPAYIKNKPTIYTKQQTDALVAQERQARQQADTTLDGKITANAYAIAAEKSRAEAAEKQNADDIDDIEAVIPSQASVQNQLADKNFVNSSIATNTANFVGTYNSLAELQTVQNPTNNDYGFVIDHDAAGNEYYDRYKYVTSSQQWLFEYKVESTPFTAVQWAAIQSGITSALVTKLTALPTNAELQHLTKEATDAANAAARNANEKAALAEQEATEAGRVNATVNGTELTVIDRNGVSVTQDVQGPKGDPGDKGDPSTANIDIDGNEIVVTNNEGVEKRIGVNPIEELLQLNLQTDQTGLQEDPLDGVSVRVVQPDGTVLYSGQWQGEQISLYIKSTAQYKVLLGDVTGYLRPAERWIYPILHNVRNLTLTYVLGTIDTIYIDDAISDPAQKVSGDVNGPVLRWIRANTHNYLCKHDADRLTARMYVCQLDDTTRLRFHDGTLAKTDGTMGDVMNMLPDFYTRYGKDAAGRHKIEFARIDYGEGWMHWGGLTDLLGCYEMYVHNGLGYSRSGVGSTGNITQPDCKNAAQTRGDGYTIVKQWHQNVYGTLFYALYGHTNCQLVCGFGTSSHEKVCGADTDVLGMTDTVGGNGGNGNSGSINFLGLENWWGNKAEWVHNVEFNVGSVDYVYHITEDDGTVRLVQGHSTANTSIYKRGMTFGDHLDLIGTPSSANGSDSTGYCDSNYHGNLSDLVVFRSSTVAGANGGVACSIAYHAKSSANAAFGSRLAFHGEVVVVDRVADYLNLYS